MNSTVKRYLPYVIIVLAVYLLVPLIFLIDAMKNLSPIAYYFVFPAAAIVCSAHYCSKYGMDFFFSLIAPVAYLPSMTIYNGGFQFTNIILLVAYLVASIFGLFIGDIAFGDKRREEENEADSENEAMLLAAKRRDEAMRKHRNARTKSETARKISSASTESTAADNESEDDFDLGSTHTSVDESEIDDILSEYGEGKHKDF